jgi:CubicO group peptidase (beta-lactamase class C family)
VLPGISRQRGRSLGGEAVEIRPTARRATSLRRVALVLAAVALLILPAGARAAKLERDRVAAIERVLTAWMTKHGVPGLSVAVAREGEVVWSAGYGFADVENSVPAKAGTMYRTASMGKSLTAAAAMRLVEEGRIQLDEPIQSHCDSFPPTRWPLTLRHLLSHLGGVRHYGGPRDAEEQASTVHYASASAALAPFRNDSLRFEPGTDYLYSSYGYDVIGCALEGAAGAPFMEVLRRTVFEPAGMLHACQDDPSAIVPNRAAGYVRRGGELRVATHVDMSNRLPAGGCLASAPEMAAFEAAFMDGRLVRPETRDLMLTEARLSRGGTVNYGLGWAIVEDSTGHVTGRALHGGSSPGASGMMFIIPAERIGVVIMTNLEDAPERAALAESLAEIARRGWKPR